MTLQELCRQLNAKGRGRKFRSHCPIHQKGCGRHATRTLAIFEDKDGIGLYCFAGCAKDDVLAALGLTWKDLKNDREWISPQAFREQQRKREAEETAARETRIGVWCVRFIRNGYTADDRWNDTLVCWAADMALSVKPSQTWERVKATHMERIEAADYCMKHRMLPTTAKPKWEMR